MGEITVLNAKGDVKIEWKPDDEESVTKAREEFDRLKADGYNLYTVEEVAGKPVKEFDPALGRLIAAPGAKRAADKKEGTRSKAMAGGPTAVGAPLR